MPSPLGVDELKEARPSLPSLLYVRLLRAERGSKPAASGVYAPGSPFAFSASPSRGVDVQKLALPCVAGELKDRHFFLPSESRWTPSSYAPGFGVLRGDHLTDRCELFEHELRALLQPAERAEVGAERAEAGVERAEFGGGVHTDAFLATGEAVATEGLDAAFVPAV